MRATISHAAFLTSLGLGMLAMAGGCADFLGITELSTGGAAGTGGHGGAGAGTTSMTGGAGGTASPTGGTGGVGGTTTMTGGTGGVVNDCPIEGTANCEPSSDDCETTVIDNPAHCGSCNNACSAAGYCLGQACAEPELLAEGALVADSQDLVVTSTHAYWTTINALTVARVPVGGGIPESFVTGQKGYLLTATPDGATIFWVCSDEGTIRTSPTNAASGGTGTIFANSGNVLSITNDGTRVFWSGNGGIYSKAISGGAVTDVASDTGSIAGLAVDSAFVYWTVFAADAVRRAPKAGGATTSIATAESTPWPSTVDQAGLYWLNISAPSYSIRKWTFGGQPVTLATGDKGLLFPDLEADATRLFWADPQIWQVDKSGGPAFRLSTLEGSSLKIAASGGHVYWVSKSAGKLMRIKAR